MGRLISIGLVVAAALLAGLAVSPRAGSATAGTPAFQPPATGCRPKGSVTLAQTREARVYRRVRSLEGRVYGCVFAKRVPFALTAPQEDGSRIFLPPALKLRGTIVGYAFSIAGYDASGETIVRVDDLSRLDGDPNQGNGLSDASAGLRGDEQDTTVGSLALAKSGAVAWISCEPSRDEDGIPHPSSCRRPGGTLRHVFSLSPNGLRRGLDRARKIDPASLRLRGAALSWTKGRRAQRATLR